MPPAKKRSPLGTTIQRLFTTMYGLTLVIEKVKRVNNLYLK